MKNKVADMMCITTNGDQAFAPEDLQWVLTQDVRADIMYAGITQEALTTDLVAYRRDWFNKGGTPFITFRDYCEWINIFAYDDSYQMDRGDALEDIEIESGDTTINLQSTDGWLTLEAFAVWKRMEKYENNVEYLAMSNEYTPTQSVITAPILKRQISTTVFPMIHESGIQTVNETGLVTDDKYIIKDNKFEIESDGSTDSLGDLLYKPDLGFYGWAHCISGGVWGENTYNYKYYDAYKHNKVDPDHVRHVKDRFEYNETYNIRPRSNYYSNPIKFATDVINDVKFAKKCDSTCGGSNDDVTSTNCNNPTHAKWLVQKWQDRYGLDSSLGLKFDEIQYSVKTDDGYMQFYIPYNTFKKACRQIKASYTQTGKENGYANYMKYWARNGSYTDICSLSAYPVVVESTGYKFINNTYLSTDFWSQYDGTRDPYNGANYVNKKAIGF